MNKIILGVTGGIAAYKAAELARLFVRNGTKVQVVMTPAAAEFVAPLTFQTLTERPAYVEMYAQRSSDKIRHIELLDNADVLVVAPATANTIAKMATGIADNLLTTIYLAADCPVVVVPSMNVKMYEHPALQENLAKLRSRGCHVMDPDAGELACGVYGRGRMPEPADIFAFTRAALMPKDFHGLPALITAGPTREYLDPVRFLSNPSTGLMGYALARALSERGAQVTLISGPTYLAAPAAVKTIAVTSADQMYSAVMENYDQNRLVIKAAAVSDFRPRDSAEQKVKKNEAGLLLELAPNRDILSELGAKKGNHVLVGFAAETESAVENAHDKLIRKNLDLIIVNNLNEPGAGFAVPTNRVSIINRLGVVEELPLMAKAELAHLILDRVGELLLEKLD